MKIAENQLLAEVSEILSDHSDAVKLDDAVKRIGGFSRVEAAHLCLTLRPYFTDFSSKTSSSEALAIVGRNLPCSVLPKKRNECDAVTGSPSISGCPYLSLYPTVFSIPVFAGRNIYGGRLCAASSTPLDTNTENFLKVLSAQLSSSLAISRQQSVEAIMFALTQLVATEGSLEVIYKRFFKILSNVVSFSNASIAVPSKSKKTIFFYGVHIDKGRPRHFIEKGPYSTVRAGHAMDTQSVLIETDIKAGDRYIDDAVLERNGILTSLVVPMFSRDKAIAALCLGHRDRDAYIDADLDFLQKLSVNLSLIMDKQVSVNRLQKQKLLLQEQHNELKVSREISRAILSTNRMHDLLLASLRQVKETLDCDSMDILIKTDSSKAFILPQIDFSSETISMESAIRIRSIETSFNACLTSKQLVVYRNIHDKNITDFDRHLLERHSTSSCIVLPLFSRRRPLGVLVIGFSDNSKIKTKTLKRAEMLAREVSVALDRAIAFNEERKILDTLQNYFLPEKPPDMSGWDFHTHYSSATRRALVGGDFYDFIQNGDKVLLVMGDVCGKGIGAAATTMTSRLAIRAFADDDKRLGKLASKINHYLIKEIFHKRQGFVALFLAELDLAKGNLRYIKAGQPPPMITRLDPKKGAFIEMLDTQNCPPLGVFPDTNYPVTTRKLHKGETLTLYTDGLSESGIYKNDALGEDGIAEILRKTHGSKATTIVNSLMKEAKRKNSGVYHDDIAVVVLKRT